VAIERVLFSLALVRERKARGGEKGGNGVFFLSGGKKRRSRLYGCEGEGETGHLKFLSRSKKARGINASSYGRFYLIREGEVKSAFPLLSRTAGSTRKDGSVIRGVHRLRGQSQTLRRSNGDGQKERKEYGGDEVALLAPQKRKEKSESGVGKEAWGEIGKERPHGAVR